MDGVGTMCNQNAHPFLSVPDPFFLFLQYLHSIRFLNKFLYALSQPHNSAFKNCGGYKEEKMIFFCLEHLKKGLIPFLFICLFMFILLNIDVSPTKHILSTVFHSSPWIRSKVGSTTDT